jgi:hypothetical protein
MHEPDAVSERFEVDPRYFHITRVWLDGKDMRVWKKSKEESTGIPNVGTQVKNKSHIPDGSQADVFFIDEDLFKDKQIAAAAQASNERIRHLMGAQAATLWLAKTKRVYKAKPNPFERYRRSCTFAARQKNRGHMPCPRQNRH